MDAIGRKRSVPLRALTEDEMCNGLERAAWRALERQAEGILVRRLGAAADDTLEAFGRRNRDLAERRLANGVPAFVKVDGVEGIVRQMPDGTRDVIEIVDGAMTPTRRLPPVGGAVT